MANTDSADNDTQQDYTRNFPDPGFVLPPPATNDPLNDLVDRRSAAQRARDATDPNFVQPIPNWPANAPSPGVIPLRIGPRGPQFGPQPNDILRRFFAAIGGTESGNNPREGYQGVNPVTGGRSSIGGQYQQSYGFQNQYANNRSGRSNLDPAYQRQAIINYAKQVLARNPNITVGQFYAGYHQGTSQPGRIFRTPQGEWGFINWARRAGIDPNMRLADVLGNAGPDQIAHATQPPQRYIGYPYPRSANDWGKHDHVMTLANDMEGPMLNTPYMPQAGQINAILNSSLMGLSRFGTGSTPMSAIASMRFRANYLLAQQKGQQEAALLAHRQFDDHFDEMMKQQQLDLQKIGVCYAANVTQANLDGFKSCLATEGVHYKPGGPLDQAMNVKPNPWAAIGSLMQRLDNSWGNAGKARSQQKKSEKADPDAPFKAPDTVPSAASSSPTVSPLPPAPGPFVPPAPSATPAAPETAPSTTSTPAAPAATVPSQPSTQPTGAPTVTTPAPAAAPALAPGQTGTPDAPQPQPLSPVQQAMQAAGIVPSGLEPNAQRYAMGDNTALQGLKGNQGGWVIRRGNEIYQKLVQIYQTPGLTGDAAQRAVASIDPQLAMDINNYKNGATEPPSRYKSMSPQAQLVIGLTQKIDPTITPQNFFTRSATVKAFYGPDGRNIRSLATAARHIDAYVADLNRFKDYKDFIEKRYLRQGTPADQELAGKLETEANAVAHEFATALKNNGAATIPDIAATTRELNLGLGGKNAVLGSVDGMKELLRQRLLVQEGSFAINTGWGSQQMGDIFRFLGSRPGATPEEKTDTDRIIAMLGGNAQAVQGKGRFREPPPGAPTATNPKTGQRMFYKDGKWQTLQ
jgi:hypothetical protein